MFRVFPLLLGLAFAEPVFEGDVSLLKQGAEPCASCHADIAAQWSASAHHFSSFNNPYYRVSVEEFRAERGAKTSRFCAGCHEPALLASGLVDKPAVDVASPEAQAGVVCLVCHSIDSVSFEGNSGYHAKMGELVGGKDPRAHSARYRAAIVNEARLCSPCHKVGLRPDITHDRWLRGQDDWDAWLSSAASGNGAPSLYRPKESKTCQDCHMPLEPVKLGDAAAKNGLFRSHSFLGANAALPHLRGDGLHEARTAAFLGGKVSLDVRRAPDDGLVDIVMRARGIGHRFPGGTMDSNQVWLEVFALDKAGNVLGKSGVPDGDGNLPEDTHYVRALPVDGDGRPLLRRDPQHMRGVAFDASLSPSDPQAVRFRLPAKTARVEAHLLYRKFSAAYARSACARLEGAEKARCLDVPTLPVATGFLDLRAPLAEDAHALLDHGLALGEALADSAGEALPLLQRARRLLPNDPVPLLGEMRVFYKLGRTDEITFVEHPASLYLSTVSSLRAYRPMAARAAAEKLAALLPNDPTSLILLSRARGLDGDAAGSLAAADRVLALDPDHAEACYQRALALAELGRTPEAETARAAWLAHRQAVELDQELRQKWRDAHTGPDESLPLHIHDLR
jgi:tetratricopeptide (TPR) repeat protein